MSIKDVTNKVTAGIGKQVLVAQKHSPAMLFAVGIAGMTATAVLACRATLKLSEVLEEGEENLKKLTEHEEREKALEQDDYDPEPGKKASFGIKLQTSIKIARLYAPAVVFGVVSVGFMTGSHVILQRRNAALTAACAIANQSFKDYRRRVIDDQGKEKDLEYRFGTAEREIAEEGPNGLETRVIKGPDQKAVKASEKRSYARVFDQDNTNWTDIPHQNQYFIQMVENHSNAALRRNGFIFLNDVYDMLGFKRTKAGQQVGWVYKPQRNPQTGEIENDCYVDFGVWDHGMYKGKEWVNGDPGAIMLDFNVDGIVLHLMTEEI